MKESDSWGFPYEGQWFVGELSSCSKNEVLSTLHAANLQLSSLFFVEVARMQVLSPSDAPSLQLSSLFSGQMVPSLQLSSLFGGFTPKIRSKIRPFLGYFGQRPRVLIGQGASNMRLKAIIRPKIKSTVPGAIFGPWRKLWNPNFRVFDPCFGPK